ncbi:TPA: hypothetical protein I7722_06075 [Vibrio vulnificus]|nr:hypothetical protein [Vibrio vulnificus]HAS8157749.1 hypothetical protein [Vibrio vulnificus]HAS8551567.1 hypothetical protein [Vibrio vulnificus]
MNLFKNTLFFILILLLLYFYYWYKTKYHTHDEVCHVVAIGYINTYQGNISDIRVRCDKEIIKVGSLIYDVKVEDIVIVRRKINFLNEENMIVKVIK